MLEDVGEAVLEVVDRGCVLVEEGNIVLGSRSRRAINGRQFVFRDVCIFAKIALANLQRKIR
jgi:hypothetical protein